MSLYSKRASQLEIEGLDVVIENGNDPARGKAPTPAAPTTAKVVAGSEVTIVVGDKRLKVVLSKDGQHLEIEYLVKTGTRKAAPTVRMSL